MLTAVPSRSTAKVKLALVVIAGLLIGPDRLPLLPYLRDPLWGHDWRLPLRTVHRATTIPTWNPTAKPMRSASTVGVMTGGPRLWRDCEAHQPPTHLRH